MVAEYMATQTDLDEVQLIVSPHNPLKDARSLASEEARLEMCMLAVQDNPQLTVNDVEFSLSRPSYTIDTLEHLKSTHSDTDFVLIMGSDNLEILEKWKRWQDLIAQFNIYVYQRPRHPVERDDIQGVKRFYPPMIDLSSTYIRGCIASGASIRYLVPDSVRQYIVENQLFSGSM